MKMVVCTLYKKNTISKLTPLLYSDTADSSDDIKSAKLLG
jgi:hypothetical protein